MKHHRMQLHPADSAQESSAAAKSAGQLPRTAKLPQPPHLQQFRMPTLARMTGMTHSPPWPPDFRSPIAAAAGRCLGRACSIGVVAMPAEGRMCAHVRPLWKSWHAYINPSSSGLQTFSSSSSSGHRGGRRACSSMTVLRLTGQGKANDRTQTPLGLRLLPSGCTTQRACGRYIDIMNS